MLMLKRLDWCPYWTIASMDSPQRGGSDTDKFQNIMEGATILDAFEVVYEEAQKVLHKLGYSGIELHVAELYLKPLFQSLRHGLGFDWVVNSCVSIIVEHYPFSPHFEYKGTSSFIEQFKGDCVFATELESLHNQVYEFLDWVFEGYPDRSVYKRMAAYAGTDNLTDAYAFVITHPPKQPLEVPLLTASRINYAVLLMEMLSLCVGKFKRDIWTSRINSIKESAPGHDDLVLVVGSKFNAFAFGDLDDSGVAKWSKFIDGIKIFSLNSRVDRTDVVRIAPDEMTFFWFSGTCLYIDESKVPSVRFEINGEKTDWLNPRVFTTTELLVLNTPLKLEIKYDFPQDLNNPKVIAIRGANSTVVKDNLVTLDSEGIGETQVVFQSNSVSFKVSDPDKKYPFTFFSNKNVNYTDNFPWLT